MSDRRKQDFIVKSCGFAAFGAERLCLSVTSST